MLSLPYWILFSMEIWTSDKISETESFISFIKWWPNQVWNVSTRLHRPNNAISLTDAFKRNLNECRILVNSVSIIDCLLEKNIQVEMNPQLHTSHLDFLFHLQDINFSKRVSDECKKERSGTWKCVSITISSIVLTLSLCTILFLCSVQIN